MFYIFNVRSSLATAHAKLSLHDEVSFLSIGHSAKLLKKGNAVTCYHLTVISLTCRWSKRVIPIIHCKLPTESFSLIIAHRTNISGILKLVSVKL